MSKHQDFNLNLFFFAGFIECPLMTLDTSLRIAAILDKARKDIGYDLPQDEMKP